MAEDKKWLFVLTEKGTRNAGWWLKIDSEEQLLDYCQNTRVFRDDMEHHLKLEQYHGDLEKDRTIVAHTRFGNMVRIVKRQYGLTDTESAYRIIQNMQTASMLRVFMETGELYINVRGGFHGKRKDEKHDAFVRRDNLDFPRYFRSDIRVKRFPDGTHYYAYIGDVQVKDGDILKWDTYDEAYENALRYTAGYYKAK